MATEPTNILNILQDDSLGFLIQSSLAEQETRDNLKKQQGVIQEISQLQATSGIDRAIVNSAKRKADLSAQNNTLKVANAAGVDPTLAVDELTTVISQLAETNRNTRNKLAEYDQKRAKGVFNGGPLNWISNLVGIETAYRDIEVSTEKAGILAKQVIDTNNIIQQTAVTQNAIKQSVTQASIDSENNLLLAEAQLAAKQSELEGLKYNSLLINGAKEATKERLAALYNLNGARVQEEQLRRSLDALAQQKTEFSWRVEEKRIADQAKLDAKETDQYLLDNINTGRANRGAPQLEGTTARAMVQTFKSGGAGAKELYTDFQNGERTKATGVPMLGATPADSLESLQILGTTVAAVREETLALFKQAKDIVATNKLIDPKNKAQVDEEFNKTVAGLVNQQFKNITPGSGNIFDVGDLRNYLGNSTDDKMGISSLKNLNISQKLLLPAIEANQPMQDPRIVIQLAIAAVKKGQITSSDYLELADVYRRANEINLASKNLIGLGIVPPNAGKNLFIKNGSFGTIDVTDYQALNRELSQKLSEEVFKGLSPSGRGMGGGQPLKF